MLADLLSKVLMPISLGLIMLGMGTSLVPNDFLQILKFPKAVLVGLVNQFILLPIIAFILIHIFQINSTMAIGIMILAVCPGGVTSNLISQVCNGNIALSVTLTSIASVLSVFTIPLVLTYSIGFFGATAKMKIEFSYIETVIQIISIVLIPIIIGMTIRNFVPKFAKKIEKYLKILSSVIFVAIIISVLIVNIEMIKDAVSNVGLITMILNIVTLFLGYVSAKIFNLNQKDAISIMIESGIQNGTLAFVVALTILDNSEFAIPTAAYSIWMFLTGFILMWFFNSKLVKI